LGVSAFPAAPVGRTAKSAEPARSQLDLRVAVQCGVERDSVAAGVEVTKRQTGQRQEAARTCGLLDVESRSA